MGKCGSVLGIGQRPQVSPGARKNRTVPFARVVTSVPTAPAVPSGPASGLPHGVRQRLEVVRRGLRRARVGFGQPQHGPSPRGGQPGRMLRTQVVAVRLDVSGQRAEDGGGVRVHVRERRDGRTATRGSRTSAGWAHLVEISACRSRWNTGTPYAGVRFFGRVLRLGASAGYAGCVGQPAPRARAGFAQPSRSAAPPLSATARALGSVTRDRLAASSACSPDLKPYLKPYLKPEPETRT